MDHIKEDSLLFFLQQPAAYPLFSGRVAAKTEPYPGRWTTHIVVGRAEEVDEELFAWVREAYDFAERK